MGDAVEPYNQQAEGVIRKLKELEPATWRYRIGAWRFFSEIDEDDRIVLLTAAAHRGAAP